MYRIIGKDRFYNTDIYWKGNSLKDCLQYLNQLRSMTAMDTVKLKWEYVEA